MPTYSIRLKNPETGAEVTVPCRDDQPILEAAEARGVALPYSCRSSACSTCAAKVESGTVSLDEQFILSDGDIENKYTLLCAATPNGDCVILTHQQDNIETV